MSCFYVRMNLRWCFPLLKFILSLFIILGWTDSKKWHLSVNNIYCTFFVSYFKMYYERQKLNYRRQFLSSTSSVLMKKEKTNISLTHKAMCTDYYKVAYIYELHSFQNHLVPMGVEQNTVPGPKNGPTWKVNVRAEKSIL